MCDKKKKNNKKKNTKKLSQFLKSHISGTREEISLKFGMWSTEVGGNVHSKICLVSSRQHRATEVRKLRFLSSCQYTHGVARRLLGPHDTLPCVSMADPGWGIWGKCHPPPPPFKKLHTRSRYSNRAVNYSNKAVTMFKRQCSLLMKP